MLCSALKTVNIEKGFHSIDDNAFENCESLKTLDMPTSVTTIGSNAFHECTALETVILSPYLFRLFDRTFDGCKSLKSIVFGKSMQVIYADQFLNCPNFEAAFYLGSKGDWSTKILINEDHQFEKYLCFYSEDKPTESGRFWHYVSNIPTMW